MSEAGDAALLREESTSQRASFLELFLDLVFVFALTRVSQRLITDFTSEQRILLPEAGQTLLLFLALWIVWTTTVWATSRLDPEAPQVQVVVILTLIGSMVMAVALPEGFGDRALVFAGAYVATQVGRSMYFLVATHRQGDKAVSLRIIFWAGVSGVPWIVGGLLADEPLRGLLWTVAVVLDLSALALGWPTPRLGRSWFGGELLSAEHLAERYQQFLIIALGESIFVLGLTFSSSDFTVDQATAFGLGLLTTVLLWRIYFHRAGRVLPLAITSARNPGRLGVATAFTHLTMIAGIVLTGVGYELSIAHPLGHGDPAWLFAILGGPILFLTGRTPFEFQVFGRISPSRVAGILVLAAPIPALLHAPPLAASGTAAGVLVGVAVLDALRSRGRSPESPAPPI
ncbi:low temperature requirement protein A [Micromonospora sp. NBC_01699]|uniref:low temperature requirement protein A n=1 Tax=Micromonospora sp. NBC_01699 TaxID=2975984 RepID=UPI002E29C577|nr:low temperature requirement protein A [Micromonospora sp. NBC_01699]